MSRKTSVCHRYVNGEFFNPWNEKVKKAHRRCSSGYFSRAFTFRTPAKDPNIPDALTPARLDAIHGVAIFKPKALRTLNDDQINLVWLGHSCVLVQFDGITILTDPSLGEKCGSGGPKRLRVVPCKIEEIANVDVVLISSDRNEFLDKHTVEVIAESHRYGYLRWYCGLGIGKTLEGWGCKNVTEFDWWDTESFDDITVTFTPAQNWSGRDGAVNKTLWGSWVVQGPSKNYFHVGCTGYCEVFKDIGKKLGPFSLATIPIGGYEKKDEPLWYTIAPKEAIKLHTDIRSSRSVGIRWGTWVLTREAFFEPKRDLENEVKEGMSTPSSFNITRIGKVMRIIEGEIDLMNSVYETTGYLSRSKNTSANDTYDDPEAYSKRYRHSLAQSLQGSKDESA